MSTDWDPESVFDVIGNEEARRILAAANLEPVSAQTLADGLGVSETTVYRRVDPCVEYDLLTESVHVDEDGNHFTVYETNLERACFELDGGGYDVNVEFRRDLVDPRDDSWDGLDAGEEGRPRAGGEEAGPLDDGG